MIAAEVIAGNDSHMYYDVPSRIYLSGAMVGITAEEAKEAIETIAGKMNFTTNERQWQCRKHQA